MIKTRVFDRIYMFSPTTVLERVRARYPRSFFWLRDSTFHTARFTLQWQALVNTVMILLFPYRAGNFIIVCVLPEMYLTNLCTSLCMGSQCCWVNAWLWTLRGRNISKHKGHVYVLRLLNTSRISHTICLFFSASANGMFVGEVFVGLLNLLT